MKFIFGVFNIPGYIVLFCLRFVTWNAKNEGSISDRDYDRALAKGKWHQRFPFVKWLVSILFWAMVLQIIFAPDFWESDFIKSIE